MKLPIKASAGSKITDHRWKLAKEENRGEEQEGIHSSPRLFSQRIDLPFSSSLFPFTTNFHQRGRRKIPSNFWNTLHRYSVWRVYARIRYQFNANAISLGGRYEDFYYFPDIRVPAACSSRHRGRSGRAVAVPLIQFLGLIKRRSDLVKLLRAGIEGVGLGRATDRSRREGWGWRMRGILAVSMVSPIRFSDRDTNIRWFTNVTFLRDPLLFAKCTPYKITEF